MLPFGAWCCPPPWILLEIRGWKWGRSLPKIIISTSKTQCAMHDTHISSSIPILNRYGLCILYLIHCGPRYASFLEVVAHYTILLCTTMDFKDWHPWTKSIERQKPIWRKGSMGIHKQLLLTRGNVYSEVNWRGVDRISMQLEKSQDM